MSRAAYSKSPCGVCDELISTAGAARASHMRRHVREGKLVEMHSSILDKTEFFAPSVAQRYREATTPQENYACWSDVTPAPAQEDSR